VTAVRRSLLPIVRIIGNHHINHYDGRRPRVW